jgi:hypothetical protein
MPPMGPELSQATVWRTVSDNYGTEYSTSGLAYEAVSCLHVFRIKFSFVFYHFSRA